MLCYNSCGDEFMNIENLDLEITRRCTLNCEHCFRGDSQNINMSIESLVNIFSSVNKIETLLITGGEPFIAVNELEKMIELIVNNNVKIREIRIVSNGTVLSSRVLKIIKDLKKAAQQTKYERKFDHKNYQIVKKW